MDEPRSFKDYGSYRGPTKPTSVRFPRGTNKPGPKERAPKQKTEKIERFVRQYTDGIITDGQFKAKIREFGLKADTNINRMITKHESGDFQHHNAFSTKLLHQCASERKSLPSTNEEVYQSPGKPGKNPIAMTHDIHNEATEGQHVRDVIQRNVQKPHDYRGLSNPVYVGVKGHSTIPVQVQTDQSEPFITTWNKPPAQTPPMAATTPSFSGERFKAQKTINMAERSHHDIFNKGSGRKSDTFARPESKNLNFGAHPATRSNFNIFGGF